MNNLERAKRILREGNYTLALACDDEVITSTERGVKPLLQLLGEGRAVCGASAADRVVGKAAAMLYVLLGVKEVYADVMSELAREVLTAHGIDCYCETVTERIINRSGDGFCPMETAVASVSDPNEALLAIKAKIAQMRK